MDKKKKLNLVFSLIAILSTTICLTIIVSLGVTQIFEWQGMQQGEKYYNVLYINWRSGAPIIAFASLAALLAVIKIVFNSINLASATDKSSEKFIWIVSLVSEILIVIGFVFVVFVFKSWSTAKFLSEDVQGERDYHNFCQSMQSLILVGIPTMFVASITSLGLNIKATK